MRVCDPSLDEYCPTEVTSTEQLTSQSEECVFSISALQPVFAGVRAHESSLSAAIVVHDFDKGEKVIVTASMDKTIAAWRLAPNDQGEDPGLLPYYCEVQKIPAPGGPIFCMAPSRPLFEQSPVPKPAASTMPSDSVRAQVNTIFCGNAAKEVVSWQPLVPTFNSVTMEGHSGWVRAIATYDKYLLSSSGSKLRVWDCTYATPKLINKVKVDTGDILCVCAGGGFVYTGGADGSLRCYSFDKTKGTVTEVAALEKAHAGRVVALLRHNGFLYSCGCDGSILKWVQGTMQPVGEVLNAHGKDVKVHCMAVAGNGVLYTGGDDQLIRAWDPSCLEPMPDFEPLKAHDSAVRLLVAGKSEILLSGDAEGYINFFQVPSGPAGSPAAVARDALKSVPALASVDLDAAGGAPLGAGGAAALLSTMTMSSMSSDDDDGPSALQVERLIPVAVDEFAASLSPSASKEDDESLVAAPGCGDSGVVQALDAAFLGPDGVHVWNQPGWEPPTPQEQLEAAGHASESESDDEFPALTAAAATAAQAYLEVKVSLADPPPSGVA